MQALTIEELHRSFEAGRERKELRPVVLLGAGASMPNLPTARVLATEIVSALLEHAGEPLAEGALPQELAQRIDAPHLTLEVLSSMVSYRSGRDDAGRPRFEPARLWNAITEQSGVNVTARCVAALAAEGLLGGVVTSNFDAFVPKALKALDVPYRLYTQKDLDAQAADLRDGILPVVAFHGTVHRMDPASLSTSPHSPPTSALARGLATPFRPRMRDVLERLLCGPMPVFAIGYSGSDHYDMNPLLQRWIPDERLGDWIWFSYSEDKESGFSPLVLDSFPDSIRRADAAQLLSDYVHVQLGRERPCEENPDRWRAELRRTLAEFELRPDSCRELVADLRNNLPGAWVSLEHYYLYSSVYDENVALTFGGIHEGSSSDARHLEVLGTDWSALLRAQDVYWKENKERGTLPDDERPVFRFPATTELLNGVLESIDERLGSRAGLRPVDVAMLLVGKAFAQDYLGLIANKARMAYDALLASSEPEDSRRADWTLGLGKTRERAMALFSSCERLAREAGTVLGRADADLVHLVQHDIWAMIGKENLARAMEPADAVPVLRECIEERWQTVDRSARDGADEYRMSHLPQIWLRASEMIKSLLGIRGRTDTPSSWNDLDDSGRSHFDFALENARRAYGDYQLLGEVNMRFPAYHETELLAAASRADLAAAERAVEACEAERDAAAPSVAERQANWIADIRARLENVRSEL